MDDIKITISQLVILQKILNKLNLSQLISMILRIEEPTFNYSNLKLFNYTKSK